MAIRAGNPTPGNDWLGWPDQPWGPAPKQDARHGNRGGRVRYINSHLHYLSGQNTSTTSDYFSYTTVGAVRNYQTWWGLAVDGWVGPQTGGVMDWHTTL